MPRLEKPLCYCGVVRPSSAARPKDDKDDEHPGLTVVVADSFQELVIDSERHVFLDVYADWCGPCLQAKPHFHKLAALLRACDDIGICGRASIRHGQSSCLPPGHWLREHERFAYNLEDLDLLAVYLELSKAPKERFASEKSAKLTLSMLRFLRSLDIPVQDICCLLAHASIYFKDIYSVIGQNMNREELANVHGCQESARASRFPGP
ncbi:unnamed protein product [Cladocopium goreaui]|uniref:Protein disulfide isomerase-like 1-4 (AtPDIL1-4) (Protein disulfide isomerase 2) (AtPDI2) (Protein disulfide isomerase-like 2-2) (AtPDIL2-2) n=1 Tax=Cladocopium goreaui TaxID=2562237 RepID=A0A9P1CQ93_9DINO|nr:unnamed protein product [Cladocopium goreaui]